METTAMTIEEIDPVRAGKILERNKVNRKLSSHVVMTLAKQMSEGEWQMTGDAIRISTDGNLLDGQHRLHAVIESGTTITTLVITGLDSRTQEVMDTGKYRTVDDLLTIAGMTNARDVTTVARSSLMLRVGIVSGQFNQVITRTEMIEFVRKNENPLRDAANVATAVAKGLPGLRKSKIGGPAYDIARLHGAEQANEFFDRFRSGVNLGPDDPVLALRNWILTSVNTGKNRSLTEVGHAITRAWEAHTAGERLTKVQMPSSRDGFKYVTTDLSDLP